MCRYWLCLRWFFRNDVCNNLLRKTLEDRTWKERRQLKNQFWLRGWGFGRNCYVLPGICLRTVNLHYTVLRLITRLSVQFSRNLTLPSICLRSVNLRRIENHDQPVTLTLFETLKKAFIMNYKNTKGSTLLIIKLKFVSQHFQKTPNLIL